MTGKKAKRKGMNSQKTLLVRASISFPPDLYETLEEIAKHKKVSLAWVVREASERYAEDETGKSGNGRKRTGHRTGKPTRRST
jgi:metal-responsive CopG/Arc/MetJ family transcriptional regulator